MATNPFEDFMEEIVRKDKAGAVTTPAELRENQFGMPLRHYAQQYLFGATGLRLKVFHSIAGVPASCKSPLLFDLMAHICADAEHGGLGGIGFLYELEDKISPTLLQSMLSSYGLALGKNFKVLRDQTIEEAMDHLATQVIPAAKKHLAKCDIPIVIGLDSIGGASASDTVEKISKEGVAGKGYYNKAHYLKYFCENAGKVIDFVPMVVICVNQEKEQAAATPYGPPQKKITGGVSQVFKDGHMISTNFKTLASGDGKIITIRTTKTSFCDARKIEVCFRWNKFGTSQEDAYGHHFEWALASAKCIADPEKGVGDIRDICDVKISDQNLVTSQKLNLKSVTPEVFEQSLFAPENAAVLNELYAYQKIERIKSVAEYADYIKRRKSSAATAEDPEQPAGKKAEKKPTRAAKKPTAKPLFEQSEEATEAELPQDDVQELDNV